MTTRVQARGPTCGTSEWIPLIRPIGAASVLVNHQHSGDIVIGGRFPTCQRRLVPWQNVDLVLFLKVQRYLSHDDRHPLSGRVLRLSAEERLVRGRESLKSPHSREIALLRHWQIT